MTWHRAFEQPRFRLLLAAVLVTGAAVAMKLPAFFHWIDAKPGDLPKDPLLGLLRPRDASVATFTVLYGALVLGVAAVVRQPLRMVQGLCAYVLILLLRMATMALFTFEPPPGIIPLIDPFTQVFYPGATPFLKDLFFSGHTATLMLATLMVGDRRIKWVLAICTIAIGTLVLVQHVHWTVDVLAAVPAAWLAWSVAGRLMRALGLINSAANA